MNLNIRPLLDLKFSKDSATAFLQAVEDGKFSPMWAKTLLKEIHYWVSWQCKNGFQKRLERTDWEFLFQNCDDGLLDEFHSNSNLRTYSRRLYVCLYETKNTPLNWMFSLNEKLTESFGSQEEFYRYFTPTLIGEMCDFIYSNNLNKELLASPLLHDPDILIGWVNTCNSSLDKIRKARLFQYLYPLVNDSDYQPDYCQWLKDLLSYKNRDYIINYETLYPTVVILNSVFGGYKKGVIESPRTFSYIERENKNHHEMIRLFYESPLPFKEKHLTYLQWLFEEELLKKREKCGEMTRSLLQYIDNADWDYEKAFMVLDLYYTNISVSSYPDRIRYSTNGWTNLPDLKLWKDIDGQLNKTTLSQLIKALRDVEHLDLSDNHIQYLLNTQSFQDRDLDEIVKAWLIERTIISIKTGAANEVLNFLQTIS